MLEKDSPLPPVSSANLIDRSSWQAGHSIGKDIGATALPNLIQPKGIMDLEGYERAEATKGLLVHNIYNYLESMHDTGEEAEAAFKKYYANSAPELLDARQVELQISHDKLLQLWPEAKECLKKGTRIGIDTGYMPTAVKERSEKATLDTTARVVDSFVMGMNSGTYNSDTDEINVGHEHIVEPDSNEPILTIIHELTHKVSGGTFRVDAAEAELQRPRTGFSNEMSPARMSRTGLNEAITQHMTMGIATGDFETIDPDKRKDGDMIYYGYRKVVAAFVEKSGGIIGVKTMTNAYYEDSGPGGSIDFRRAFVRQTTTAFGSGALTKLEKLCEATDLIPDSRVAELIDNVIHPPVFDSDGLLLQPGYIDTAKLEFTVLMDKYLPVLPSFATH